MNKFLQIDDFLKKSKEVAIFSHIHPDGDAIGSQLALGAALKQAGIEVILYNTTSVDKQFDFLNGNIKMYGDGSYLPSVVIFLDCHDADRVGISPNTLESKSLIVLDHHKSSLKFSDETLIYIDPDAPATCEIVMSYLLYNEYEISPEIATALYLGMSTDTGSFMYESVTAQTYSYASFLLEKGADFNAVRLNMYENTSKRKFTLLKYLYSHTEFFAEDQAGICAIPYQLQKHLETSDADFEGLANIIKEVAGVEVGIVIKELPNKNVKISFRGKQYLPLHEIAAYFGGGGHARAAGARVNMTLEETSLLVKNYIKKEILRRNKE